MALVKIRFAKADDVERLVECYLEIWDSLREWLPASFVNPELESIRKPEGVEIFRRGMDSKDGINLIAEEKGEIVGLITGQEHGGVGRLGFFGVKKEHRRRKIGSTLLGRFIEEAKARKAHKVWLYTSPYLLQAIDLYIKNGFVPEGFLRNHTHGLDLIVYSKFI